MTYPTMEEVEQAGAIQLARWQRFLKSPGMSYLDGKIHEETNPEDGEKVRLKEAEILDRIMGRLKELGGMTPQISKEIGWGK